jgi:multiple sugar transport system ATP-binding protein
MATVSLKKVEKVYPNGFKAVHGIDLDVKDGEFMVLVGPSGCAKSTTLRMIAGLEEISGGEIWIGQRKVNDIQPKDRDIAMVFQNYALYPHMTAYENMAFVLRLRKTPADEIDRRVYEAAEILEITPILNQKPKQMSGGQMQRVAVGRAIVRKPKVFLFDEPLSNLDAKLRVQMRVELSKLHKRLKATMIYVTHDQVEAMTMGSRICVMEQGRIKQVDTPINLYSNPSNIFVAGFIGSPSMNLVESSLIKDNGFFSIKTSDMTLTLPSSIGGKVENYVGRKLLFGLRPDHIYSVQARPEEKSNYVDCDIIFIENMGNDLFVYFSAGANQYVARLAPNINIDSGEAHRFWFDCNSCHLFDMETRESIL